MKYKKEETQNRREVLRGSLRTTALPQAGRAKSTSSSEATGKLPREDELLEYLT